MTRSLLASLAFLLALGCDDGRPASVDGGGGGVDGGGGGVDAGDFDAGDFDGGVGGGFDAGPPLADVGLTFTGCSPDFGGFLSVVSNTDSIAVASTSGSTLTGSLQIATEEPLGTIDLSTQHRIDSGTVVNLVIDTTWTNIAMDSSGVLGGTVSDPIGGSMTLRAHDRASGILDVDFDAVTLQNPSTGSICQIDGRLQTFGLTGR